MTSTIHELSLGMVNAYLIQGDGVVLVDTGMNSQYDKLIMKIEEYGVSVSDIKLVLVTHAHSDHFGSAHTLQSKYGIPVAVHESVYVEGEQLKEQKAVPNGFLPKLLSKLFGNTKVESFIPDISLKDEDRLEDYGVSAKVIHTPGHTKDSLCILTDDHEMIVGDMMNSSHKHGVREPMFLEDRDAFLKSIKKIISYNPSKLFCSHSHVIDAEGIEKLRGWIG